MLSGFDNRKRCMNVGNELFAQVMECVPCETFAHIQQSSR
jgi:hypothetical protein